MNINVVSYNGTNINDGTTYLAWIERSQAMGQGQVDAQYISRAGAWPILSGKSFKPTTFVIKIDCAPGATVDGYLAKFETLNQLFSNEDETPRALVVQDADDSDRSYTIYCTPTGQPTYANDGAVYTVKLALDDPVWQSSTDNTVTWVSTSTTDSTDVTVGGNDYAYPVFEITATTQPSSDYLYGMYVQVLPRANYPWTNRMLNLTATTDSTFDTAALVGAGKMQADGDDVRVFCDGVEIDRWLYGMNTTDTQVWVVEDMPKARNMTLKTALSDTDETTIELNYTNANKRAFNALDAEGRLIIDSGYGSTDTEEFTYTARKATNTRLYFTVGERGVRGTTAIAHAVNSNVRFLPHDYSIVYGNPVADAPDVDDTQKPIVSLASTNRSLIYSNFYDLSQSRAGIWLPDVLSVSNAVLTESEYYTSTNDAGDTDPATEMGLTARTYEVNGAYASETVKMEWRGYFPDSVASVSAVSGDQYQTIAQTPAYRLQSSTDGVKWTLLFTVAKQASSDYSTWTDWTKASSDAVIPANTRYLRFMMGGTVTSTTDDYRKVGVQGVTVGLTNFPHVMRRTEANNIRIDATIGNVTTGESFRLVANVESGKAITIDTDPSFPYAKYQGKLINGAVRLNDIRAAWLRLAPGTNTLTYDSNNAGANDMSITVTWKDRLNAL